MKKSRIILMVCFMAVLSAQNGFGAERPNVILMMADDMGMGDTSAYQDFTGNTDKMQIATPQMDRLARMGVRFTDAHTPTTRCTGTRYGLMTGRYPWRNRLKHFVLYGAQGDPMIEADRPTLATLMHDQGYHTAMVGKWHIGLRYRKADGSPAAGWEDADLTQPLADSPLDHGFDFARFTSRSHGTSGPQPGPKNKPTQTSGPGHITNRKPVSATDNGKKLIEDGPDAYVLTDLGGRHSDNAIGFMNDHLAQSATKGKPFFLYYASNSNHAPHTPDNEIGGVPVKGEGRNVAGEPMGKRHDFVYENDVALGRLIDYLEKTDDPRNPGKKLRENTVLIFTSDNGAEIKTKAATGPFRSNKGSVYEGGHRVPFIVSWPGGKVGDGNGATPGNSNDALIGLKDMFATFSEILGAKMPDPRNGEKGGEDSLSVLAAWKGKPLGDNPVIINDHIEAKDHAAAAIRLDNPIVGGKSYPGQWKLFFDAALLRCAEANPTELYDLVTDQKEQNNRIDEPGLKPLKDYLAQVALTHRTAGGHRLASFAPTERITFDWRTEKSATDASPGVTRINLAKRFVDAPASGVTIEAGDATRLKMTVAGTKGQKFSPNFRGLGITGGKVDQVDNGEALIITFDHDVIVESAEITAGNGTCGGFYQIGKAAPLAIYCIDADIDYQDQSGLLSDIGVLKKGTPLRLDSAPHLDAETAGVWRLTTLTIRIVEAL